MIPLSSATPVKSFPHSTRVLLVLLAIFQIVSYLWPGTHEEFLLKVAFVPAQLNWESLFSLFTFPHLGAWIVSTIFIWTFMPSAVERSGLLFTLLASLASSLLALWCFYLIYKESSAPLLTSEAPVSALLGIYMRHAIWSSVNTLVIGWGWIRIYEVPSYVLLFFWLFYSMLCNLFLPDSLLYAPMQYSIPLISFLAGFLLESARVKIQERRPSPLF